MGEGGKNKTKKMWKLSVNFRNFEVLNLQQSTMCINLFFFGGGWRMQILYNTSHLSESLCIIPLIIKYSCFSLHTHTHRFFFFFCCFEKAKQCILSAHCGQIGAFLMWKSPFGSNCQERIGKKHNMQRMDSLCAPSLSRVQLSATPGLQPTRLICPWDSPGKNTGLGCHALLQGFFPTQGSNPHLLHWQVDSLPLSHLGSLKGFPKSVLLF